MLILYTILAGLAVIATPVIVIWVQKCLAWRKAYRMGLKEGRKAQERKKKEAERRLLHTSTEGD